MTPATFLRLLRGGVRFPAAGAGAGPRRAPGGFAAGLYGVSRRVGGAPSRREPGGPGPGPERPREHGISAALELVVYASAFMLLVGVLLYGGRLALADVAVSSAAGEAARAASLTRTPAHATAAATFTANDALDAENLRCGGRSVTVDTADFALAVGRTGEVTVTVSCIVDNADLVTVGVPGSLRVSRSASSPLDAYRLRG